MTKGNPRIGNRGFVQCYLTYDDWRYENDRNKPFPTDSHAFKTNPFWYARSERTMERTHDRIY